MVAQKGKDLLVKIDMDGSGTFETLAGLRATRIAFQSQTIDVTHLESDGGWRELLDGGGVKSASVSGSGIFRDADTDARARALFFGGDIRPVQVIVPDFGIIEGPFQISALEYAGNHDGEARYEMSFVSAGALGFDPL
ncbi:phage major tail protein, TP901-1 family [Oceanomicrobium pacificus]|uniref:Phage major tail protein, TP901-1 family n=1 Tax=Oceanomicrobium pacificus TaxID=2692916 RepID=A0A6B0TXZ5_9RHOB|nr:phage major tail protein, TP901-1 family [Oceanomicrobium pacificus]MXU66318.1 phage major tail protein, TP901-1 family [Oceanomicrobium pacificus]